jgi:hypothetical protein
MNLHPALINELRKGRFERAGGSGLYLPSSKVFIKGLWGSAVRRGDRLVQPWQFDENIVVNEGLNHILNTEFHATAQITTWYIGIFEGNYTPVAGDTAANIAANSTESTAYTQANRVEWVEGAAAAQSITNPAASQFNINATKTIYGAFLVSSNVKSGVTGTLFAASRFASSRAVVNLDQILVTYTLTAADA